MSTINSIQSVEDFWTREFAYYLNEHRSSANRATHMIGIPILIVTAIVGLAIWNGWVIFLGQIVGWAFQLIGHRIEGNRPALLKRPISFLMGPLMVLVEMIGFLGFEPAFAARARQVVFGR